MKKLLVLLLSIFLCLQVVYGQVYDGHIKPAKIKTVNNMVNDTGNMVSIDAGEKTFIEVYGSKYAIFILGTIFFILFIILIIAVVRNK